MYVLQYLAGLEFNSQIWAMKQLHRGCIIINQHENFKLDSFLFLSEPSMTQRNKHFWEFMQLFFCFITIKTQEKKMATKIFVSLLHAFLNLRGLLPGNFN